MIKNICDWPGCEKEARLPNDWLIIKDEWYYPILAFIPFVGTLIMIMTTKVLCEDHQKPFDEME
jgi:hypothetical protein